MPRISISSDYYFPKMSNSYYDKGDENEAYEKKYYFSCIVYFQLLEKNYIDVN